MGYVLGVDLGTTYTSAAVADGTSVEAFTLGAAQVAIPSVVALREDGTALVGEGADHRSLTDPTRTAREFKRRLGDPAPYLLGGVPYGAERLTAELLRGVVASVVEQRGEAPSLVVLTHPASWGPYKLDQLDEAARLAEVGAVARLTEPQAAAVTYAAAEQVPDGTAVAVYDLGGGTFDAAVVRATDTGFELLGTPEGIERFGGIDVDQAVVGHVDAVIGGLASALDPAEPTARQALARLRADCRRAKEVLSSDTEATIPVLLPTVQTEVRLTRAELEAMIRPRLEDTVAALERAVASSGLAMADIDRVLLVGGASRMPLVGELVASRTGRPVHRDAHPKMAIASGAARWGHQHLATTSAPVAPVEPVQDAGSAVVATTDAPAHDAGPAAPGERRAGGVPPIGAAPSKRSPVVVLAVIAVLLVVGVVGAVVLLGGGSDEQEATVDAASSSTSAADDPSPSTSDGGPSSTEAGTDPADGTAPAEVVAQIEAYLADATDASAQGAQAQFQFQADHAYPAGAWDLDAVSCTLREEAEEVEQRSLTTEEFFAWWDENVGPRTYQLADDEVVADPGWVIPGGPAAGEVPDGDIYLMSLETTFGDGTSKVDEQHVTVLDGEVYAFQKPCGG